MSESLLAETNKFLTDLGTRLTIKHNVANVIAKGRIDKNKSQILQKPNVDNNIDNTYPRPQAEEPETKEGYFKRVFKFARNRQQAVGLTDAMLAERRRLASIQAVPPSAIKNSVAVRSALVHGKVKEEVYKP